MAHTFTEPFPFSSSSSLGCPYYRIPSLLATREGVLLAAMDARFGGTPDSPNAIGTAVARSLDSGKTWEEPHLAASFQDWAVGKLPPLPGRKPLRHSASTIDPSLLQDSATGRIFLLVDAFPWGMGAFQAQKGSGYRQGRLLLRRRGRRAYGYFVGEDGAIRRLDGSPTPYKVDASLNLSKNGRPLTVGQRRPVYWQGRPWGLPTGKRVPMHLFYQGARFQVFPTSYLFLLYSDDLGKTWSTPREMNGLVKEDSLGFFGVCPGQGAQLSQGPHAGRLVFPAYALDARTGRQQFRALYSDDGGSRWQAGTFAPLGEGISSMSETQLLPCPDGALLAFSRTTSGFVARTVSLDGGATWQPPVLDSFLPLTGGAGCQVSALGLPWKNRDAVLVSAPAGKDRTQGVLSLGFLERGHQIRWAARRQLTEAGEEFAYSCLAALPNGKVGLLYETSNRPQAVDAVRFRELSLEGPWDWERTP